MAPQETLRIEDATPVHTSSSWMVGTLLAAAAVGVVWWFHLPLDFDMQSPSFNPMVFVPVVLLGFGVVQIAKAVRGRALARRFGATRFEMEGKRAAPGETLVGRILTARDMRPAGGFLLRMPCIECVRLSDSTDGMRDRTRDEIRWESVSKVEPGPGTSTTGILVRFTIPRDAARKTKRPRRDSIIRWTLDVSARVDGQAYEALFGVPVSSDG